MAILAVNELQSYSLQCSSNNSHGLLEKLTKQTPPVDTSILIQRTNKKDFEGYSIMEAVITSNKDIGSSNPGISKGSYTVHEEGIRDLSGDAIRKQSEAEFMDLDWSL